MQHIRACVRKFLSAEPGNIVRTKKGAAISRLTTRIPHELGSRRSS